MSACRSTELQIQSVKGCEKIAMDFAVSVGRKIGLSDARIEDLKTAVSEACLNAMEHGNKMNPEKKVVVTLTVEDSMLQVAVHDEGKGIGQIEPPRIEDQIEGKYRPRGWGLFLIKGLMDGVDFETRPEGGNVVRMIINLTAKSLHGG